MNTIKKFFAAGAVLVAATVSALTINGFDATGRGHLYDLGWAYAGGVIELSSTDVDAYRFVVDSAADTPISAIGVKAYDCHLPNRFEVEIKNGIFTEAFGMNRLDSNLAARVSLKIDGGTFNCRHDPFLGKGDYPAADYSLCDEYLSRYTWRMPFAEDLFKESVTIEISGGDFAFDPTSYVQPGRQIVYDGDMWHVGYFVTPEPELFDKKADTPFAGNTTYTGWVRGRDGGLKGTLVIKTGKPKQDGTSKPTVTYIPIDDGKKQPVKVQDDKYPVAGGTPTVELPGVGIVKFGGESLAGVGIDVQAGVDLSKSKKTADKQRLAKKAGAWTFALGTEQGHAAFSVVVDKKGKGKLSGTLPNGAKVSATSQGVLGEKALAVPFAFSKKNKGSVGFVFWVNDDGTAALSDVTPIKIGDQMLTVAGKQDPSKTFALADGEHDFKFGNEFFDVTQTFTVAGKKWTFPKANKKAGAENPNPYNTKLTYAPKSGVVKGSFVLLPAKGRNKVKYTVNGVVVGAKFYGSATAKKVTPIAVSAE